MALTRTKKAKLNVVVSLAAQLLTIICGLIVPKLIISTYGSTANGVVTSIAGFLAFITLLEGGVGGVARAALYKPLAENDAHGIGAVVWEVRRFFRVIGCVFAVYTVVLGLTYKYFAHVKIFDALTVFLLVAVISIATFAQYFIGISYSVLLQAAQKTYITTAVNMAATILNAAAVIIIIRLGGSLLTVKFVGGLIFAVKPFALWLYCRKSFAMEKPEKGGETKLEQKWSGLGQHLAFFLHTNTDVAVLTLLKSVESVSVYGVYNNIVSHIQSLTASFSTGMEALFGDMLAKGEKSKLDSAFSMYETLISFISISLYSVTSSAIIPFIKVYIGSVKDVDYIEPVFARILVCASLVYCLRLPYHAAVIAAGRFRETRWSAYGEAALNVAVSVALVIRFGLVGVAAGTLAAMLFRLIYYVFYLSRHVLDRPVKLFVKRLLVNAAAFAVTAFIGRLIFEALPADNYVLWAIASALTGAASVAVTCALTLMFYRADVKPALGKLLKTRRGS